MATQDTEDDSQDAQNAAPSIDDLLSRANKLLEELTAFKNHAASQPYRQRNIPMRDFECGIRSEISHLAKLSTSPSPTKSPAAAARTSNLPSFGLIWATAKRSHGVAAFRQSYRLNRAETRRRHEGKAKAAKRALVDIVAEDGEVWVKVSNANVKRLLFDVAREGWGRFAGDSDEGSDLDSDGEDDGDGGRMNGVDGRKNELEVPEIPLLRTARDLVEAARANRVRGRIPRVRFVLPRIKKGESKEVDLLLSKLKTIGCELTLADGVGDSDPPLSSALERMPVNPLARLTSTLNIDCTILISLISDISHVSDLQPEQWFNAMLREQLRFERQEALLPNLLYPVLRGRRLVTTKRAADQCQVIVDTIGNEKEKGRCEALFRDSNDDDVKERMEKMAALSDWEVPADLALPIEVVEEDSAVEKQHSASEGPDDLIPKVCARLSDVNKSVFGFGWRAGWTTVTSNNNTIREIEVCNHGCQ